MLTITNRVLCRGFAFASARGNNFKKQRGSRGKEEGEEKDVFKAYRKEVEKGSILRQFREDVFRKS